MESETKTKWIAAFVVTVMFGLFILLILNTNARNEQEYISKYADIKTRVLASINSNTTDIEKYQIITFYCDLFGTPGWITECRNDLTNDIILNQTWIP